MAKLTDDIRQKILAEWKVGKTQNRLAKDFNVSPATVNKLCKGIAQTNIDLVNTQTLIDTDLASKSEYEVNAIRTEVDFRTRHLIYFQNSAMRNQELADVLLNDRGGKTGEDGLSFIMLDAHSKTTLRNKETVLGKQPDTAIQINNNLGNVDDLLERLT